MSEESDHLKRVISVNDLIHSPVRLAIMMFLLPRITATFPEIMKALGLTSGNLASHIKKMEKANFIEVRKEFIAAKPTTIVTITPEGERAVEEYAQVLRNVLRMVDEK